MIELYKNIKSRRLELGMTQSELAHKLGYADKSMIAKIEKGAIDLQQSKIIAFAKALDTTPSSLMGWEEPTTTLPPYPDVRQIGTASLPVLGQVACGEPIYMNEEREVYIEDGTEVNADFILIARGDSMTGARIFDGDLVFIRKQATVENGEIAVVAIDDEATLKRFYKYGDLIVLRAENPEYKDMEFTESDGKEIHILGKAVAFQSDVR